MSDKTNENTNAHGTGVKTGGKKRAFTKGRIVIIILIISVMAAGIDMLKKNLTNKEPLTISFEEYIKTKPDNYWVRLTDCKVKLLGSVYNKKMTRVFIPVYMAGEKEKEDKTCRLILESKDQRFLNTVREMRDAKKQNGENGILQYAVKNLKSLTHDGITLEGWVLPDEDENSSEKKKVRELNRGMNLEPDFRILRHHEKPPHIALGGLLTAIGLILMVLYVRFMFKNRV